MSDTTQTDEDQTIKKKKCQNKLNTYGQLVHRPKQNKKIYFGDFLKKISRKKIY
jgi:hypothetical protein